MNNRARISCPFIAVGVLFCGISAGSFFQDPKPIVISNIRRLSTEQFGDLFAWGKGSELFYVGWQKSGRYIFSQDLANGHIELITKGESPAYITYPDPDRDGLSFLRGTGYSIDCEFWHFDRFHKTDVEGENKISDGSIRLNDDDHFPSPMDEQKDSQAFAYRYFVYDPHSIDFRFWQIRVAQIMRDRPRIYLVVRVFYSRRETAGTLNISGWLDADTLLFFSGEEPFRLKYDPQKGFIVRDDVPETPGLDFANFPDSKSGDVIRDLAGVEQVQLPGSNFSPDGKSYLVYSVKRNAIIQKNLRGKVIAATELPSTVKYKDSGYYKHPLISRDGRHIAFAGLIGTVADSRRVIYIADTN
jgi:hypothetical protein